MAYIGNRSRVASLDASGSIVSSSTGDQHLGVALDDRVVSGEVGQEYVTIGDSQVLFNDRFGEYVTPMDFGAVGDGVADDSTAIENALGSGKPVYFGNASREYRTTRQISVSLSSPLVIRSDGAKITVDSTAAIESAFDIDLNGNFVHWSGTLETECSMKAFSGWKFNNALEINKTSLYISGYVAQNCYRSSTEFNGGDGLYIQGSFDKVTLCDINIKDVVMAAGAGISGSHGVSGITVTRNSTEKTDASLVNIYDFNIERIYSEDYTYKMDQDGIKVFSGYSFDSLLTTDAQAYIHHGRVENTGGRAIKCQTEWGSVHHVMVRRDTFPVNSYIASMPDIDFQVAGGTVSDCSFHYTNAYPDKCISYTLSRYDGKYTQQNAVVQNISVVQIGSTTGIDRFASFRSVEHTDAVISVSVSNVAIYGPKDPSYLITLQGVGSSRIVCSVNHVLGRVYAGNSVVYRVGDPVLTYVNGMGILVYGGNVPFYSEGIAGNSTVQLIGNNPGVA